MTIRVAVVGLGFGAEFLPIYQRHPDTELYAICQRSTDKLKEVGDQFGIERRYADAAELFAAGGFDFVDIATTVPSHRPLVEMAASNKIPVICQKPFAKSLADAKSMQTRSPIFRCVTPSPTSITVPAASWPSTIGSLTTKGPILPWV